MANFEESRWNLETKISIDNKPLTEKDVKNYSSKGFLAKCAGGCKTTKKFDEDVQITLQKAKDDSLYYEVMRGFYQGQAA